MHQEHQAPGDELRAFLDRRALARRKRVWIVVAVLLLVVAPEVAYRTLRFSRAGVRIENQGDEPIEALAVTFGSSHRVVPRIESGGSALVHLSGRGEGVLKLEFRQRGNPMSVLEIPRFDPSDLERDGFVQLIIIRPNEVEQAREDDAPSLAGLLATRLWDWLKRSLVAY